MSDEELDRECEAFMRKLRARTIGKRGGLTVKSYPIGIFPKDGFYQYCIDYFYSTWDHKTIDLDTFTIILPLN